MSNCSIENCKRVAERKGLCFAHYQRQRNGIPMDTPILYQKGQITQSALAHQYGVTQAQISQVVRETQWVTP